MCYPLWFHFLRFLERATISLDLRNGAKYTRKSTTCSLVLAWARLIKVFRSIIHKMQNSLFTPPGVLSWDHWKTKTVTICTKKVLPELFHNEKERTVSSLVFFLNLHLYSVLVYIDVNTTITLYGHMWITSQPEIQLQASKMAHDIHRAIRMHQIC